MNSDANKESQKEEMAGDKNHSLKRKLEVTDLQARDIMKYMKTTSEGDKIAKCEEEGEYYFENGLRKVYPYYYTYSTFCKGRWVGKTLINVFSSEFRAFTSERYRESILCGDVLVNGLKITPDYVLKDNDLITNKVHRHELGVIGAPIKVIHLSDDLVVVDKPPSVPVHPCGRFRQNTLLHILSREHGLHDLHTVHRLDRLTSGVLLLSRTLRKSQELAEQVRSHKLHKEYLSRVEGLFPDGVVTCDKPIESLPKIGACIVSTLGKECFTEFEKISYNGKSSVVRCVPRTGRMHQVRVHLQYLGFPIINDPVYNSLAFGPSKGKGGEMGKTKEQLLKDLMEIHNYDKWLVNESTEPTTSSEENDTMLEILKHYVKMEEYDELEKNHQKDEAKFVKDPTCDFCLKRFRDPEPKDMILFLHAFRYKGTTWEFQTELPLWAKDDWQDM